jgi:dihydropyrimidine dehydrogenase (NAD+) subunit PreA
MADLSVTFAGLKFKNPVIAASATPTRNYNTMEKCIKAGAGGLVTKTPSFEYIDRVSPSPCFYIMYPDQARVGRFYSLYSTEQLSEFEPEEYAKQIKAIKPMADEYDCKIISSIMTGTLEQWKQMTEMYAPFSHILELNLACPYGAELAGEEAKGCLISASPTLARNVIKAVRETTDLPLIAKLSVEAGDITGVCKLIYEEKLAEGVHLTHRFTGLEIDINTGKPILSGTLSGYGGPWMSPISRKWVVRAAQITGGNLDICGGGGIDNWRDAVAHIMAGAKVVQMAAAPIVFGYEVFEETIRKMNAFLDHHHYDSIEAIKGMALPHVKPLDQVPRRDRFKPTAVLVRKNCTACGQCYKVCFYEAIQFKKGKKASIDPHACQGCGLCTQVCPKDAINLVIDGEVYPNVWEGARGRLAETRRKAS